ncbi:MAG: phosphoribosylanthranilate isomerase [Gammaproteobacteria bacterium AqS3]|nr:phosphoribosylanthranilate isomerase [Gammaproteobacteria bacterium AqS3]
MPGKTTEIKFCGLRSAEDIALAAELGVGYAGLNHIPKTPRYLEFDALAELVRAVPEPMKSVVLLQDAEITLLERIVLELKPDLVQFHGSESWRVCDYFEVPFIKAVHPLAAGVDSRFSYLDYYGNVEAFLWDATLEGGQGGSGQTLDYSRIPEQRRSGAFIAGGLTPETVADAIHRVKPRAVDVSSGIEEQPGVKSPERMRAFVEAVRSADAAAGA